MTIGGKFSRASATTYKDGVVLVGFVGNVYPHELTDENIQYIKDFYGMHDSVHEICMDWPGGVEPWYPSAKKNFKNGYLLLKKGDCADV